jgi:hypothetical protein
MVMSMPTPYAACDQSPPTPRMRLSVPPAPVAAIVAFEVARCRRSGSDWFDRERGGGRGHVRRDRRERDRVRAARGTGDGDGGVDAAPRLDRGLHRRRGALYAIDAELPPDRDRERATGRGAVDRHRLRGVAGRQYFPETPLLKYVGVPGEGVAATVRAAGRPHR